VQAATVARARGDPRARRDERRSRLAARSGTLHGTSVRETCAVEASSSETVGASGTVVRRKRGRDGSDENPLKFEPGGP